MDETIRTAGEFTLSAGLVWFIIYGLRSWAPGTLRAWLDGAQRIWPVVFVVSLGLVVLADGAFDRATIFEAFNVAMAAVGVDAIRQVRKPDPEPAFRQVEHEA